MINANIVHYSPIYTLSLLSWGWIHFPSIGGNCPLVYDQKFNGNTIGCFMFTVPQPQIILYPTTDSFWKELSTGLQLDPHFPCHSMSFCVSGSSGRSLHRINRWSLLRWQRDVCQRRLCSSFLNLRNFVTLNYSRH